MSYFIMVLDHDVDYDSEEGAVEYKRAAGVIGPFETKDAAREYDHIHRQRFDETEIVKLTAPGQENYLWDNRYA